VVSCVLHSLLDSDMSDPVSTDSEDPMSDSDANSSDDDNLPSKHVAEKLGANKQEMQSFEGEFAFEAMVMSGKST